MYAKARQHCSKAFLSEIRSSSTRAHSTGGSGGWQVTSPVTAYPSRAEKDSPALPKNIILLRHAESMGNRNESLFTTTADWKIPLSGHGRLQAQQAGRRIQQLIGSSAPVLFYVSPYLRTKQTLEEVMSVVKPSNPILYIREEPRLREQDFGNFQDPEEIQQAKQDRPKFGRFFFRFPNGGESGADVFDRVSAFSGTFLRDMEQLGAEDAKEATAIFVTHGITSRLFIMKWFHWSVDEFEELHNPPNCGLLHLKRTVHGYELTEESRQLIHGPKPCSVTGVGRGLQLGDMLKERRRLKGLTREEREAYDTLADSAWGI